MLFISKGKIDIGYEINRKPTYALRFENGVVIGSYNCLFNRRSKFIYRCKTNCEGYSIKKSDWIEIICEDEEIKKYIHLNVETLYKSKIMKKVLK